MKRMPSRIIPSADEIRAHMQRTGEPAETIEKVLAERAALEREAQERYGRGPRSRNDEAVRLDGERHTAAVRAELEAEMAANETRREGPSKDDRAMAALGSRVHKGKRWADMPRLHLLNAARKHGDAEMQAYAEWLRTRKG